jgi:hypothetical protein
VAIRRRWFSTAGQVNDSYTTDTQLQLKEMTHIQVNTTVVITIASTATWPVAGIPDRAPCILLREWEWREMLTILARLNALVSILPPPVPHGHPEVSHTPTSPLHRQVRRVAHWRSAPLIRRGLHNTYTNAGT